MESLGQLCDALTLKGNGISSVDNFPMENPLLVIEFDFADVALVFHHGVTPASVRSRPVDSTEHLPESVCVCDQHSRIRHLSIVRERKCEKSEMSE